MKASLKTGLLKYSAAVLGVMMISCFAQRRDESLRDSPCEQYSVRDGKIICIGAIESAAISMSGFVHQLYRNADEWYVLISGKRDASPLKVGYRASLRGTTHEIALPSEIQPQQVKRFAGAGGAAFLVVATDENRAGKLLRVDFNSGKISQKKEIYDLALYYGVPVVLVKSENGFAVSKNKIKVPLTLPGVPVFGNLIEGRILTVVSGETKELIDLGTMKNIYGFGKNNSAEISEENLHVEVMDAIRDKMNVMLYYKVFVDGAYSGRTDTGVAGQARRYSVKISDDEYHVIRLERWELNEGKNTYERTNNIHQPKPVKVFLPLHRAMKLMVVRERGGYSSSSVTLQK